MITDSKVREAKSGKRKRVLFDPYLRREQKVITRIIDACWAAATLPR